VRNDDVGRYLYWSDRRIRGIAEDNNIDLDKYRRWALKSSLRCRGSERASGLLTVGDSVGWVARESRKGTVTNLIRVLEATVKGSQARFPASD
jgi:hypothetical protein